MVEMALKNVYKKYDNAENYSVTDFNLSIKDREFIVFVGPSGCGKSTTLRMIAGLEDISEGELNIGGKVMNDVAPKDRDIAMVFQNYALYPHMTVFDNMAFGLKLRKYDKADIKKRVDNAAEILGLTEYLKRKPAALSGGQRQRVALGRAIVRDAKVFLMDEPLSNLDAKLRVAMRAEIAKLHQRLETTTIYVTHDQTEAMTLGTRIVVMKDGFIRQADTPSAIYEDPADLFVAGFIGSPSMNFMEGTIHKNGEGADFVLASGQKLEIPKQKAEIMVERYHNKKVILGIRPEHFSEKFKKENANLSADRCGLTGTIVVKEMLGAESIFYLKERSALEFSARLSVETQGRPGDELRLYVDMNRVHFFDTKTEKNIFYHGGQQ